MRGLSYIHTAHCLNLRVLFIFMTSLIRNPIFLILLFPKIVKFRKDSACECPLRKCSEPPTPTPFLVVAFPCYFPETQPCYRHGGEAQLSPLALLLLPGLSFFPGSKWAGEAVGVL